MIKHTRQLFLMMSLALVFMATLAEASTTLWYNGDFNGSGLNFSNQYQYDQFNSSQYYESIARTYDDFEVTGGGWTVNSVWSNNRFYGDTINGATYEIRSGLSTGNGGTIVASGSGNLTLTDTGRGTGSYTEYQVMISGLDIQLDPGTYWLNVMPITNSYGAYSYNSATSGLNSVGMPAGNNGNSYTDVFVHYGNGSVYSVYFAEGLSDFSMGISGTAGSSPVPVPASLPLLGTGLLALLMWGRRVNRS